MRTAVKRLLVIVACCVLAHVALAQGERKYPDWRDLPPEQSSFYLDNPAKTLPDARSAFGEADYARTLMLCSMHYILYGDESGETAAKNKLKADAEKCYDYTGEMNALLADGNIPEAKKLAGQILKLNPVDKTAQVVLKLKDPEPEPPQEEIPVTPVVPEAPVTPPAEVAAVDTTAVEVREEPVVPIEPVEPVVPVTPAPKKEPRTLSNAFAALAGVGYYGGIAPEVMLGMYDIGGSRFGVGLSGYGVLDETGLWGIDLSPTVHLGKSLFVSPCFGFFFDGSGTKGVSIGAGVGYLFGNHLLVSLRGRYFPEIQYYGSKNVSTSGLSYPFPSVETSRKASFVPSISVGWAF